jgi:hypothetical protein
VSAAVVVQVCEEVRQEAAPEKVKFPAVLISPVQFKIRVWEVHNPVRKIEKTQKNKGKSVKSGQRRRNLATASVRVRTCSFS